MAAAGSRRDDVPALDAPLAGGQGPLLGGARWRRRDGRLDERGLWRVADLDTANGTFVNERRIEEPTPVRPGDVIRVSETRQRVVAFEE